MSKTQDILRRAKDTLDTAKAGLDDVRGPPARRLVGLRNLVVFGRALTNVLQNLRSEESSFDAWYKPIQADLQADATMKFFYELRSRILKRGDAGVSTFTHIARFDTRDLQRFGPKPPNAKGFFIGDQFGGTGWEVEVSPGVLEPYYVDLPSDIGRAGLFFAEAPRSQGADPTTEAEVVKLCTSYYDKLNAIYLSAARVFGVRP